MVFALSFFYPIFFLLAVLSAVFLFWRAARHELIDSKEAFDLVAVGSAGAVIFARLFDFFGKTDPSSWQIARLLFFNRYGSFDFYGAIVGMIVAVAIYLRAKKMGVWHVLDLAAAPLAFGQTVVAVGTYLSAGNFTLSSLALWQMIFYLFLFVILKRLATKKRHAGFFLGFYLVFVAAFDLLLYNLRPQLHTFWEISYELTLPFALLVSSLVVWYVLAKRNPKEDVKWFFGLVLLSAFRTIRMIKSADEAGKLSKSVIFFPSYALRSFLGLILALLREIRLAFLELLYVFGLRKFLK